MAGDQNSRRAKARRAAKGFDFTQRKKLYSGGPCKASGKRRFASRLDVLIEHMNNPRLIRAYECPHCGDWHAATLKEANA